MERHEARKLRPPFMLFYGNGNGVAEQLYKNLVDAGYAVKRVVECKDEVPAVLAGGTFYYGTEIEEKFLKGA